MSATILNAGDVRDDEVRHLRSVHYNATVSDIRQIHDGLAILRIRPDSGRLEFKAGQYTVIGLGYWERRVAGVQAEVLDPEQVRQLAKRAYSICSPIFDASGQLAAPGQCTHLEFYVALVRRAEKHAPALTPRLFALAPGDRLFLGSRAHGHYTLDSVRSEDNVVFVATGTGEAPHNAMTVELLSRGHRGRIVSVTCVRHELDLAYLSAHRQLEQLCSNYRYLTLTTREPCNLDATRQDYVGKWYLQDLFAKGRFEALTALPLDPAGTHVFLCGSPAMIGAPQHTHALRFYPRPQGMVEILEQRGFHLDEPHYRGNIHLEKYW